MILIRADANTEIATGHVMRCLSVADGIKAKGVDCLFVTADMFPDSFIESRGYSHVCLNSDYRDMNSEIEDLRKIVEKYNAKVILVDSYYVTKAYLNALRQFVKVAYIDDVNAFAYPVDILINYSVYAGLLDYDVPSDCLKLLGTDYAPVRRQFMIDDTVPYYEREKKILITAGGVDFEGMIKRISDKLLEDSRFNDYDLVVMVGKTYSDRSVLDSSRERVSVYQNVPNVAALMKTSMFAVSAGGSTLYELCALQTPTVTFSVADNQLGNVKEFDRRDLYKYAGDTRDNKDAVVENIADYLYAMMQTKDDLLISAMKLCVDGKGAERIADELIKADWN